jgi:glycosyltransferase involved in cell wall biosynthesis
MNRKIRMAYVVSHPIQYQAPLLRLLAKQPDLDLRVFFFHETTAGLHDDLGFSQKIAWDVSLVDGYSHESLRARKYLGGIWHGSLKNRLCSGEFPIVWLHGYNHPIFLRIIGLAARQPVKVLMRGDSNALITHPNPVRRWMRESVLDWCLPRCAAFLSIGKRNRDFYIQRGVSEERLFDMPYAVDNEFFQKGASVARPQRDTLRKSLSLIPGRPVILFAGKLQDHKGAMDLLEAYIRLSRDSKTDPQSYLIFAGNGPERDKLERKARSTGFSSIRFLGFQNQTKLPALYDLCDIFVLPSRSEPWGLVVNEAMNAAKPVIVSDVSGCAADLVSTDNGWVFRAGDVDSLHRVLSFAVRDVKRLESMGLHSLDRINGYSYSQDVAGLMEATSWVLRNSQS